MDRRAKNLEMRLLPDGVMMSGEVVAKHYRVTLRTTDAGFDSIRQVANTHFFLETSVELAAADRNDDGHSSSSSRSQKRQPADPPAAWV